MICMLFNRTEHIDFQMKRKFETSRQANVMRSHYIVDTPLSFLSVSQFPPKLLYTSFLILRIKPSMSHKFNRRKRPS